MTSPYPKWARWIAQDFMGTIKVFDEKPARNRYRLSWESASFFGADKIISKGVINRHWRNSLDCLGDDD